MHWADSPNWRKNSIYDILYLKPRWTDHRGSAPSTSQMSGIRQFDGRASVDAQKRGDFILCGSV